MSARHSWYERADGLYVVDDEIPIATSAERAVVDRVIRDYGELARETSVATGVPWSLLVTNPAVESGGNPRAISRTREGVPIAYGLMQIVPSTFRHYRPLASLEEMLDPVASMQVGARVLADLRKRHTDLPVLFSEYNAGPGPHPADNPWGMRMDCVGPDCHVDKILRVYNYVMLRTLRVEILGDSILVGAVPYIAAAIAGMPIELVGQYGTGHLRHEAVVGESIAKIGARLESSIARCRPDVLITMAGANDVPGSATPDQMAAAEADVLARASRLVKAVVSLATPPQPSAGARGRAGVPAAYNAALHRKIDALAAAGAPVVFVDPELTLADMADDGTHPKPSGDRKIGNAVGRALVAIESIPRPIIVPSVARPWYRQPVALLGVAVALGLGAWRYRSR